MVMDNFESKEEIIKQFVDTYGYDLLSCENCLELQNRLLEEKSCIESELNLDNKDSKVYETISKTETHVADIKTVIEESERLIKAIEEDLDNVDETRKTVQEYFDKLHNLETSVQYIRVVQRIESLSAELEKEFINKDDEKCVTIFANLCEISRNLMDSKAINLRTYLKKTIIGWHNILKEKLAKDFDEVLKAIKWPFVNNNYSTMPLSQTNMQKLQILLEYLLQIELPDESVTPIITSALLSDFPPLCLPIHFLVVPLQKRFLYHFYGGRQTNRIDKPEWYFTQILSWIRDHIDFVTKWVQPIIDKLGLHHIDAKLEFMRGLVQVAVEKLHSELPNLQFDDYTFSHSVDEALGFDKELRETYSYPPNQPSILAVLTQAQVFVKWLAMEKKYATEKMDSLLSSNSIDAFEPLASDVDDLKVTTCADTFVTLLQTITERYESLPQPGHKIQFLDLQLDLLDEFRVRLLQLVNADAEEGNVVESRIPMIANTIYYVENVLIDWGSLLHYLHMYYYKSQLQNVEMCTAPIDVRSSDDLEIETETVFANTLSLYCHMREELLTKMTESVKREAISRSNKYTRERWSAMTAQKDMRSFSLTPSACPMFEILARRLHQMQKTLTMHLFTKVWRYIARGLDNHLFEDFILANKFNDGGAMQLKYDISRNLFPLFSQFSDKPEYYFTQLKESCDLLNLSKGSALLLRETLLALEGATGVEDRRGQALKEIGVVNFSPQMAVQIINLRTDMGSNRLIID